MKYNTVWRLRISIYSVMLKLRQDGGSRLAPELLSICSTDLGRGVGSQIIFIERAGTKPIDSLAQLDGEIIQLALGKGRRNCDRERERKKEIKMLLCRCLVLPAAIEELCPSASNLAIQLNQPSSILKLAPVRYNN